MGRWERGKREKRQRDRERERKGRERQDDVAMDPGMEKSSDHNPLVGWKIRTRTKNKDKNKKIEIMKTKQKDGRWRDGERESRERWK